jgi:hypothetical protein
MARLGARLVDNGYPVLPIMPGTKKPGLFKGGAWRDYPGWTRHGTRPTSEHELSIWAQWPEAGIGIPTGTVIGADIDIADAAIASRLEQLAREALGATPAVRFGRRPKRLLVYRAAEPLCHHTKKITKHTLAEDPFQALCGAGSLRSFYTSGMIMHRPDEARPERRLFFELRNGPALEPMMVDRIGGRWVTLDPKSKRLVRRNIGQKLDAERRRKRDVILQLLFEEAAEGRAYTAAQFAEQFENQSGLGGRDTIGQRIAVLATKGYIRFFKNAADYGLPTPRRSKFGYLCVEDMRLGPSTERVDAETGEVITTGTFVLPTHYKCPQSGAVLPVEDPLRWCYREDDDA